MFEDFLLTIVWYGAHHQRVGHNLRDRSGCSRTGGHHSPPGTPRRIIRFGLHKPVRSSSRSGTACLSSADADLIQVAILLGAMLEQIGFLRRRSGSASQRFALAPKIQNPIGLTERPSADFGDASGARLSAEITRLACCSGAA